MRPTANLRAARQSACLKVNEAELDMLRNGMTDRISGHGSAFILDAISTHTKRAR